MSQQNWLILDRRVDLIKATKKMLGTCNLDPRNSAHWNLAPRKLARPKLDSQNLANTNIVPTNLAPNNLAPTNLAPSNFANTNFSPTNFAPTNRLIYRNLRSDIRTCIFTCNPPPVAARHTGVAPMHSIINSINYYCYKLLL